MKRPLLVATKLFALGFWLCLAWLVLTKCTGCAAPARGMVYPRTFVGSGTSMLPRYAAGDVVQTTGQQFSSVKIGETIVYASRRGFNVCHVVVGHNWNGFITKGTNNAKWDEEYVTKENFVGIVKK